MPAPVPAPLPAPMPAPFRHRVDVRYYEVDQQGVVFNAWYLAWFDEAMMAFLEARGLPYAKMLGSGHDVMLVRTEIDWRGGVGWHDDVAIEVATARVGTTSFALDFVVHRGDEPRVSARTTYVVVATDDHAKRPVPRLLLDALGDPTPLRPAGAPA